MLGLTPLCVELQEGGEEVTLYLEMACNEMFGVGSGWTCGPDPPDEGKTFALKTCKLAPFDVRAWDLLWVRTHARKHKC